MSDKDLTKKDLQEIKNYKTEIFDDETLPKVKKKIDKLLEELDKEMVEDKKVIAEIDRVLLATMSYEELKEQANLFRLRVGYELL